MEEILASIRRIISEDSGDKDQAGAAEASSEVEEAEEVAEAAPPPPVVEEEPEEVVEIEEAVEEDIGLEEDLDEILDLTEPLPEEPAAAELDFAPEPEPEVAAEVLPEPEPEYEPEPVSAGDESEPDFEVDEDIAFGEPVMSAQPTPSPAYRSAPEAPAAPSATLLSNEAASAASAAFGALASNLFTSAGGSRTLEDLVADLLRPMLKEWLDQNLPPLVEQLVREEIERVARRGR